MANVINNGIPLINGMLCGWADVVVLIGGVPVTGIVALEYNLSLIHISEPTRPY